MRNTGILTTLVGFLLLAGTAAAATLPATSAHGTCVIEGANTSTVCEAGAYPADAYYDADAAATTRHATGTVDADGSHTDAGQAADGSIFGWFSLRWSSFVEAIGAALGMAGQDAPNTDGAVDLYASTDGVDLDATVGGVDFDGSAAGDLDGKTFETLGKAHAAKSDAMAQAQQARSDAEGKLPVRIG